ncbi:MAG: ABC transporter ATP-binding protein [Hyphomicrobiales bacterium]|nr:ABC transporter ATP-binding protein [Hyphomicrobiales bacterium]
MDPAGIEIREIKKQFGSLEVLKGINLTINPGEFVCLLGPSGCGKSTLLRILAGLEQQTQGELIIGGRNVSSVPPKARDIAMVFQSFALYPHLTVSANIAAPLVMSRLSFLERQPIFGWISPRAKQIRRVILEDVQRVAHQLQIDGLLNRKPSQLSGGQKQRVAIGRAIVRHPRLFLMDEPLSNLDAGLRAQMRGELVELQRRLGITTIFVTHDQTEAMSMADRIVVMMEGRVMQVGSPLDVFNDPHHVQVARFIGTPAINLLPAFGARDSRVNCLGRELAVKCDVTAGESISIGIRPENVRINSSPISQVGPVWSAITERVETLGHETLVFLTVDCAERTPIVARLTAEAHSKLDRPLDGRVQVSFDALDAKFFDASGARKGLVHPRETETDNQAKRVAGVRK